MGAQSSKEDNDPVDGLVEGSSSSLFPHEPKEAEAADDTVDNGEMAHRSASTAAAFVQPPPNVTNLDLTDEERIAFLESRVLGVEQLCGIPDRRAPRAQKLSTLIVFQVYHKLLLFGKASLPLAILVLAANVGFVVGFSIHQMRNTCIPNISLIDGDLPDFANQQAFRDSGNVFICTSSFNSLLQSQATNETPCSQWTPCTLNGLSDSEYDLRGSICPVVFNGCYRHPNCINDTSTVDGTTNYGMVEVCQSQGLPEIQCQGVVSITYYACPSAGTVIGAALGYSALVQLAALLVLVLLYLSVKFLMTGRCYSISDMMQSFAAPGSNLDQVAKSNRGKKDIEDGINDGNIGVNGTHSLVAAKEVSEGDPLDRTKRVEDAT